MSKDSINKTTLYEERKRNEVPRGKLAGFSPVGKANRGKTKVWCSHSCAGFSDDVIVLFSVVVLIFYAGFWYLTNVVACIKYVPYIFHYRLYAPLAILWQGIDLLSVPPPACYFAAILLKMESARSVAWATAVCPWGTVGRNINTVFSLD